MRIVAMAFLAAALAAAVAAQSLAPVTQPASTLAGTWMMQFENFNVARQLTIGVEGRRVTGKLDTEAIEGEVENGRIVFASPETWRARRERTIGAPDAKAMYSTVYFAERQADGRLKGWSEIYIRGYGPQAVKRMDWTGSRK